MAFDPKENDISVLTTNGRAEGFSISPTGDYMAVDYHGEIMIVPTEAGVGERTQVTNSPWRDQAEAYSPDGKKIAYVSDETGDQEVWVFDIASGARKKLTAYPAEKSGITWSNNSQKLAYTADNRIFEVDVAGGPARELAHNEAGGFNINQYSADGNWLLYGRSDDEQNADVYLYDIASKKEYNVTQSPWAERTALLTPDGKTVVFASNRNGATNQLYAVTLSKIAEDPNDPLVRERIRRMAPAGGRGGRGGAAPDDAPPAEADSSGRERNRPSRDRADDRGERRWLVLPVSRRQDGVLRHRGRRWTRRRGSRRRGRGGSGGQRTLFREPRWSRSETHRVGHLCRNSADGRSSHDLLSGRGCRRWRRRTRWTRRGRRSRIPHRASYRWGGHAGRERGGGGGGRRLAVARRARDEAAAASRLPSPSA